MRTISFDLVFKSVSQVVQRWTIQKCYTFSYSSVWICVKA